MLTASVVVAGLRVFLRCIEECISDLRVRTEEGRVGTLILLEDEFSGSPDVARASADKARSTDSENDRILFLESVLYIFFPHTYFATSSNVFCSYLDIFERSWMANSICLLQSVSMQPKSCCLLLQVHMHMQQQLCDRTTCCTAV
jgi:hypothetical protein